MVNLSQYDNSWFHPGGSFLKRAVWMLVGQPIFASAWLPASSLRVSLLRLFGARIGVGVVIKPDVRVKYPWHLVVGDHCWIGEECWIDNLTTVRLGSHACLSQGVYLCTGNHDWADPKFGLMIAPIQVGEGAWAGAKSILAPGVTLGRCSVAAAGAVVFSNIPDFEIHAGNPAKLHKMRELRSDDAAAREEVHP
jgi:putative colanic acid biosynthesis acetyltransferase WcaF